MLDTTITPLPASGFVKAAGCKGDGMISESEAGHADCGLAHHIFF